MRALENCGSAFYPRFYLAAAIVAFLFGIVVVADRAVDMVEASSCVEPFGFGNVAVASRIAAGDYYEGEMSPFEDEAPEQFVVEVADTAAAERVYVAAEGSVVALEIAADGQNSALMVRDQMEARGWTLVESGSEMRFSAVKGNGSFRWAYVDVSGGKERSMATFVLKEDRQNEKV